jgi:general secretion pathway protein D
LTWQGPNQAKVGDQVTLAINSSSGLGVRSLGLLVGFDAAVLKVIDVAEGDLLKQTDPAATFSKTVDPDTGQIVIDLATPSSSGSRNGTVATITFEVREAVPESHINISRIVPGGAEGEAIAVAPPSSHKLILAQ